MSSLITRRVRACRLSWRPAATPFRVLLVVLAAPPFFAGCALLGKADMLGTRYFEPAPSHVESANQPSTTTDGAAMELQLGRVTASSYLKSRLVYRTSSVELGTYEDRQWTERPEAYARRAMAHALFDAHGIEQVLSGTSPTLELELAAFEEVRDGDQSTGRVTIRYVLRDDTSVWISDSITVDRATKGGSQEPEAVVAAISAALIRAASDVAGEVVARLRQGPARVQAPPCAPVTDATSSRNDATPTVVPPEP